ncbi:MAG: Xaa-Pro peptidase family protein [Anaerolineae bacterium]
MLRITDHEYQVRCEKLNAYVQQQGYSGVVLFERDYILYYTGFAFIPTERPIVFMMNQKGERALFVPRMEVEHAQSHSVIDRVGHYIEYPSDPHPMEVMKSFLTDMGITGKVTADQDGYPWIFGYRGPALTELGNITIYPVRAAVEDQMMIKSPAELNLMRESCRWGNLALRLLQRYTVVGATETEVETRASAEATLAMLNAIGPIYKANTMMSGSAHGIYRGQIGRNASIPHALANNITFQAGDVLVGEAGAPVWGYGSELERSMVLGKPTDEQRRLFDHMVALQDTAFAAFETATRCSDIDVAVRAYYEKHDLTEYWRHHTGHAIGSRYHEAPFLDRGDHTELKPGMVFTIEPGLYHPQIGGFRHSDMVLITDDGIEIMTYYPRDLESLTLPAS